MPENIPLFGASVQEVGVNVEGTMREGMRAKDIAASKGDAIDFGQILGQAAQLSTTMSNAEKMSEANTAKQDYYNIVTSQGYLDGDATIRTGMLEEMNSTLHERPKAYQDAYIGYSGSTYAREYEERGKIEDNALYSSAPSAFKVYEMETGEDSVAFVDDMSKEYPRLDKSVIRTSLLSGMYEEIYG